MTRLFRSKSCGLPGIASSTELNKAIPSLIAFDTDAIDHCEGSGESEDEDKEEPDAAAVRTRSRGTRKRRTQVVLPPGSKSVTCSWKNHIKSQRNYYDYNFSYNYQRSGHPGGANRSSKNQQAAISMVDVLMAALRKSLVTCRVVAPEDIAADDSSIVDISWPTEVRHVSHVTFDRFDGFLGLPTELEPHVPKRMPSARSDLLSHHPAALLVRLYAYMYDTSCR